jgi:hypothetical protein
MVGSVPSCPPCSRLSWDTLGPLAERVRALSGQRRQRRRRALRPGDLDPGAVDRVALDGGSIAPTRSAITRPTSSRCDGDRPEQGSVRDRGSTLSAASAAARRGDSWKQGGVPCHAPQFPARSGSSRHLVVASGRGRYRTADRWCVNPSQTVHRVSRGAIAF